MSIEETIKQEMAANDAMQQYFKQFADDTVRSFINSYAVYKSIWLTHGKHYADNQEHHGIQWVSKASEHLQYIQQKKLFDAQCLWRSEQLDIPEIQLCYDFMMWEKDILNCRFIEPVNESDIELYAQYLLTHYTDYDISWRNFHESWQDYTEIIEAYTTNNENRDFPEWYDFYNGCRGTGVYMTLPDIRGEKEAFYMELARNYEKANAAAAVPPPQPFVASKYLFYHDKDQRDWFVQTFENKEVQAYYKAYEWSERNKDLKEELGYYLEVLYEADEPVAMEAHIDWAEAVKNAAKKYTCKKIAEALPEAWEQYMMNIQLNIAFPNEQKFKRSGDAIRNMYEEGILLGRKVNGEPEDFNF
jgi:hypothetical protein